MQIDGMMIVAIGVASPSRVAARIDGSLSASHFHSYRRYRRSSKTRRIMRNIASVAARVRCKRGEYMMPPTSMLPAVASIRM